MFSLEQALAENTRILSERNRNKVKKLSYVLYFSNNMKGVEGKIMGYTIKELIQQFKETRGSFKFAVVTRIGSDVILRSYNSANGKKFISHTRVGKKKVK